MSVSIQNITLSQIAADNSPRIRVRFEYSANDQQTWTPFAYQIPNDLFAITDVGERERIARELIFAIARAKGHINEDGTMGG